MIFKVLPKFKSKEDGEYIYYNDNLLFCSIGNPSYLSFSNDSYAQNKKVRHTDGQEYFRASGKTFSKNSIQYKLYLTPNPEKSWKIEKYSNRRRDNDLELSGLDLVKLQYTELDGYMGSDLAYLGEHPEVYIKNYKGPYMYETASSSCIWEIDA